MSLITLIFILVIIKIKEIDLCVILLLAALFSITWRSTKLLQGENIIEKDGLKGLFGRGLKTKILSNGLQGLMFTVIWRTLEEKFN